jgi:hypothetical protein
MKNKRNRAKVTLMQMTYCQWFSAIECKQAKLVSVPERVPENAGNNWDSAVAKDCLENARTQASFVVKCEGLRNI